MHNWRLDLFSELDSAHDMHAVLAAALKAVRPFGFEHCGWRALLHSSALPQYALLHSSQDRFIRDELDGRYDTAPVPQHCQRSMTPISWQGTTHDRLFLKAPVLWEEFYECGHRGGWAQSLLSGEKRFSMLYVDSPHVLPLDDMQHIDTNLRWITAAVLCRMDDVKQQTHTSLTAVERDILRWLCEGKHSDDIAQRLTIPACLVEYHVQSAMVKLKAPTRKAAIARAVFLGLL